MELSNKYSILEVPKGKYDVLVLVQTYQSEKTIEDALISIDRQSFGGSLAVLIHDDASTDKTRQIISGYMSSSKLDIFRAFRKTNSFESGEIHLTWQLVLSLKFDFLAICDGDDVWLSENKLSAQVRVLEKRKNVALVYHGYEQGFSIRSQDNVDYYQRLDQAPELLSRLYCSLRLPTIHSSTMYRKDSLDISNIHIANKLPVADFILLWSSLQHGSAHYIPGLRFFYRLGGSFNPLPKAEKVAIRDVLIKELGPRLNKKTLLRLLMTEKIKDFMKR